MEIKTTKELFNEYPKICYAGVETSYASDKDKIDCDVLKNKRWVPVEDVISFVMDDSNVQHLCNMLRGDE